MPKPPACLSGRTDVDLNQLTLVPKSTRSPWERVGEEDITCVESFHHEGKLVIRRVWAKRGCGDALTSVNIIFNQ